MSRLPEGIVNGPSRSEHLENGAQSWERPWTLEEMRQSSANWSLAADSGLFLFLQDFSQRMLSKTHDIEKQLDSLIRDTKNTDSCLHSVFNDFLMLSNTQFIENRVYDEEVEETIPKVEALEKQPEQEKTREQKEAELIPKMQEAVNHGLKVLESAFEHLDIKAGNSDSEDEEVTDRLEAILEPKDLYVDRPLPYLIGSHAFMNQEDVGLGDLSSDEMSVDSDRDSVIESEDGEDAVHSDDDFNQEEEERHNNIRKKPSMVSYDDDDDDEDEEEDSDIFGESDGEDNDDDTKNTAPSSFADELAARIKGEPVTKPEGDRASAEEDSDDMFKPPKMEDEDFSPFGGKGGLFSGGRGLFDDDDEGDLFSDAPNPPASEEKKVQNERLKSTAKTAADTLFKPVNNSDAVESKENGIQAPKINAASKQTPPAAVGGVGGGLFDDDEEEEEEDDFFSSKSLSKSDSAGKKTPKAVDLFDEDDDGGDIFSEKSSAPTPTQSKKEVVEGQVKQPERKMPAGAISIFGPGTQSLLNEGLKKRQQSTSEESEKSEENGPAPDAPKSAVKPTIKPKSRGLFSDEEDIQESPTIPRSQSKPELTSQSKTSKAPLSLFDDEEEEDLFASAAKSKSKPNSAKASTPQPSKALSSSLFSDDEDQWESSKSSAGKSEVKTGGMKPSVSAPSSFLSAIIPQKGSVFDGDDDDLFTPTTDSSQKKFQRVALLFEDENDGEGKGSLFGDKPPVNRNTAAPAAKTPAVASQSSSLLEKSEKVVVSKPAAKDKPSLPEKPRAKSPEPLPSAPSPDISESKKKPVGGVSLFGGIDVFANKQTKSPLDEVDQEDPLLSEDGPPPNVQEEEERKEEKVKINTVSLFDDEEEDESDWNEPIFTPSKPTESNTVKPTEERPQAKSTGVFLDEELLFSQTQQKDNDPDVDLFATSGKPASSKPDSVKPAAKGLFSDEDEDDLFSSIKAKDPPPKIAEKPSKPNDRAPLASPESVSEIQKPAPNPVKPKDSSSRIGKLQANLMINPAALLPGAAPSMLGASSGMATSSSSGVSSSSLSPSPVTSPVGAQTDREGGVSFEIPVQVATLQSVHKSRVKGSAQRRPQSRAGRQQPAQQSSGDKEEALGGDVPGQNPGVSGLALPPPDKSSQKRASPTLPDPASPSALPASSPSPSSVSEVSTRPSVLTLPVSTNAGIKDSSKDSSSTKVLPFSDDEDLFGSAASSVTTTPPTRQTKTTQPEASSSAVKKDSLPSLFDANTDELFQKVKPRSTTKKATASSFLEDEDEDIFGVSNRSTPTSTSSKEIKNGSFSKQDIFQDEVAIVPEVHKKHKEKTLDASLFDDNIDIFADMTDSFKPKQKSKTKGETKSIFDDDMDDIFSPSTAKAVTKPPHKSKKTPPSQETSTAAESSNIFDDPLNALGGN
ncbi:WASH complex subunit 2 isoform X3 [Gymnodraco acuticeps]|uniref:WASH complex subunit 2 isoform X3 n=1 Tax=Gymnodraco acuticeps TaxID=8218 RepID=A0A6P8T7M5_GYMAC|nr:WASH complex subunit 2 isoform X3 [Gymnodraco acuticeps]